MVLNESVVAAERVGWNYFCPFTGYGKRKDEKSDEEKKRELHDLPPFLLLIGADNPSISALDGSIGI